MTTPTDQELEKVAREKANKAAAQLTLNPEKFGRYEDIIYHAILSALKQVQPTPITKSVSSSNELVVPTAPQKPLVDSIAVSPQEKISAVAQNVEPTNETREDSSDDSAAGAYRGEIKSHARTEAMRRELNDRLMTVHRYALRLAQSSTETHPLFASNLMGILKLSDPNNFPPPASTPANPPKEGRASAESETGWRWQSVPNIDTQRETEN